MIQTTRRQTRRSHREGRGQEPVKAAHGAEADNQAQGQCPDQGDEKQLKGLEKSRCSGPTARSGNMLEVKKFNHGIVLSRSV